MKMIVVTLNYIFGDKVLLSLANNPRKTNFCYDSKLTVQETKINNVN